MWPLPGWESGCVTCYLFVSILCRPPPHFTFHSPAPSIWLLASALSPDLTRCICIHLLHASQNSTRHSTKLVNDWPGFLAFTSSLLSHNNLPTIITIRWLQFQVRFDIFHQQSYHQGSALRAIKTQEAEVIITNNYKSQSDSVCVDNSH